jgi:hypothetical protein
MMMRLPFWMVSFVRRFYPPFGFREEAPTDEDKRWFGGVIARLHDSATADTPSKESPTDEPLHG